MAEDAMKRVQASSEQSQILDLLDQSNVVVDSVAGSGKTTTSLFIMSKYKHLKILLLTFNKKIKIETRQKVAQLKFENVEVHSYHSFCVKYYDSRSFTDSQLFEILKHNTPSRYPIDFDMLLIDEAQDIYPVLFQIICKIMRDLNKQVRMCVLGDKYQSIYEFKLSDQRYISLCDKVFKFNDLPWSEVKLSCSFRITNQMADFVNKAILRYPRLKATKDGHKPRYIICDCFGKHKQNKLITRTFEEVKYYLNMGYRYEDIFVIAPSLLSVKNPVRVLANLLSIRNIPVFVSLSDEERIDDDVLRNKIVFSSFHQVKGLERKVVIVFGFDNSYFKYYKKNTPSIMCCPNEIYVAITRASEQLSMIHHYQQDFLPFIDLEEIKKTCYTEFMPLQLTKKNSFTDTSTIVGKGIIKNIGEILRHLPCDIINESIVGTNIVRIEEDKCYLEIPNKSKQGNLFESVSDINSIAIPALFEYKKTGTLTIFNMLPENTFSKKIKSVDADGSWSLLFGADDNDDNDDALGYSFKHCIDRCDLSISKVLYISTLWLSKKYQYIFKTYQIRYYNWLSESCIDVCIERLSRHIDVVSSDVVFEKHIEVSGKPELHGIRLTGYIDCIDRTNKIVWIFKCLNTIESEHILQLILYMYLFLSDFGASADVTEEMALKYKFRLFNILDNTIIEVSSTFKQIQESISCLICYKYQKLKYIKDDDEFIKDTEDIRNAFFAPPQPRNNDGSRDNDVHGQHE